MTPAIKKMILNILKDTYNKIENDTCGLDEDEILSLANTLTHVKLNIEQTCKYINCSRATLHRMIIDGRLPKPKKTLGGDKYWFQDEIDDYIKVINEYNLKNEAKKIENETKEDIDFNLKQEKLKKIVELKLRGEKND